MAILKRLDAAVVAAQDLQQAAEVVFIEHPNAEIITSFPGLGTLSGARMLAEIGDDPDRFETARDLKAYAGAAPVTRASGKSHLVMHRWVKNHRLASAGYNWAFAALSHSPVHASTTTADEPAATDTPQHCATSTTGSSGSSTTA